MPSSTRSRIDPRAVVLCLALLPVLILVGEARAQEAPPVRDRGAPQTGAATPQTPPQPPPPEPSAEEKLARSESEKGQRQYDLGRFDEAIDHYARAYEAMPLPALLFNIAQCHRQLGHDKEAAFFYRRYLDLAKNPPNAAVAKELLAETEKKVSRSDEAKETAARAERALKEGQAQAGQAEPLYKRWWFWAGVGAVVAAGATAVAISAAGSPSPSLGTVNAR